VKYQDPPPEEVEIYTRLLQPKEEKEQNGYVQFMVFKWTKNDSIVIEGEDRP